MEDIDRIRARLLEAGATAREVEAAGTLEELYRLAGDVGIRPTGAPIGLDEVARRADIPVELAVSFVHAAGLSAPDLTAPVWYSSDVGWMGAAAAACVLFGEQAVLALLRRAGGAMSQLSTAASSVFRVHMVDTGDTEEPMKIVERNLGTRPLVDVLLDIVAQLYRYHSRLSFRDDSVAVGSFAEVRPMTVGFVDLASSTELGAQLPATELAQAMNDFNSASFDIATRHGARIVKTIGDEAMLAALSAPPVVESALELVEYFARHEVFTAARAGVSSGDVLEQDGDCYGPVVNRAARFVEAAPDGTVMVDDATAREIAGDHPFEPRPAVTHRGLGEPRGSRSPVVRRAREGAGRRRSRCAERRTLGDVQKHHRTPRPRTARNPRRDRGCRPPVRPQDQRSGQTEGRRGRRDGRRGAEDRSHQRASPRRSPGSSPAAEADPPLRRPDVRARLGLPPFESASA